MIFHCIRLLFLAVTLVGLALGMAKAETIAMSPTLQKIVDGAREEGSLTLSFGANILGGADGARVGAVGIKAMFGIDLAVNYYPGPSFAPMVSRLYTEKQANQVASTDLFNATAVEISPYLSRDLFRAVPWTQLYPERITPAIVEAGGRALRIATKLPGVMYNKRLAPQFGKMTTMHDLLNPDFKGKIYSEPYLAGFDVLVAKDYWGYDKTAEFVREFSKAIGGLVDCGAAGRIASGEVPALALSCAGAAAYTANYRDVLGEVVLHDAAMRRFDYLTVPTNAAHPNAAILFALYASSPEGQSKILHDLFGGELDSYADTQTHQEIVGLEKDGVTFTNVTIGWWGSHEGIDADLGKLTKIITQR